MATTYFVWDPLSDSIMEELDDNGNVVVEYTREPDGRLISENRGGVHRQYLFDAEGNTLALTDDDQNVTDTFAYSAFGEITERTGPTSTPFQYKGEFGYYRDELTGDYIVRRRPLTPHEGRWRSPDPAGVIEDVNLYRYVRNSPLTYVDPSGTKCVGIAGPYSPSFAKETWFARIEGNDCGKEGGEGAYKVVVTFWAWDASAKECSERATALFKRHEEGERTWKYRGGESKCETVPVEVRYRKTYTPPPGKPKQDYHACPSVTFVFQCPVICSDKTCRPYPLGGKGTVCIGTSRGDQCALVEWSISFPEGDSTKCCPPCEDAGVSIKLGEDNFFRFL